MKILTYTVLLFVLVSCASKKKEIEIIPPDKLYERAMKKLKNNSPEAAAEDFERVEAENPFSKYSSKSIIMAAYSYYYAGEYDSSLSVINYIKKTSFDYLDYIYYLEALNKYEKFRSAKKDLDLTKDLYKTINIAINKFPDSMYVEDLRQKFDIVLESLAKKEFNIVKFYISQGNFIGALNHCREILFNYPENKYTPNTLYAIYTLYKHIGYDFGANTYSDLIKAKYPKSVIIDYLD